MKRISEDIFAEWRKHRFVLVEPDMHEELGHMVILTDFKFWAENISELMSWCNVNGGEVNGSTVLFRREHDLTAFVLRWS